MVTVVGMKQGNSIEGVENVQGVVHVYIMLI